MNGASQGEMRCSRGCWEVLVQRVSLHVSLLGNAHSWSYHSLPQAHQTHSRVEFKLLRAPTTTISSRAALFRLTTDRDALLVYSATPSSCFEFASPHRTETPTSRRSSLAPSMGHARTLCAGAGAEVCAAPDKTSLVKLERCVCWSRRGR